MGWLALAIAACGAALAAAPPPGVYLAMGFGILGLGVGRIGYRRINDPGAARLAGAAAMALASLAIVVGTGRYVATLAALGQLETLL